MEDVTKYFRWAILFPVLVTILVALFVIPVLCQGTYEITYAGTPLAIVGRFVWPTPGFTTISSPFGRRNSPTAGASSYHQGIDIVANQGSNVYAISGGIVTFAGWSNSGGYMVIIEHANGYDSRYCHMGEHFIVAKGDTVYAGQVIGTVGPKYVSGGRLNGSTTRSSPSSWYSKGWNFYKSLIIF